MLFQQSFKAGLNAQARSVAPKSVHSHRRCFALRSTAKDGSVVLPSNVSSPVTDAAVPEGHQGLHATLYGQGGAEEAHSTSGYRVRKEQDDGSVMVPVEAWLNDREGEKPLGVYAIHDESKQLQYVGYSRNMVTAIRGHLTHVGAPRVAYVRGLVFANKAMATREHMEREMNTWLDEVPTLPPGNAAEKELWEGVGKVLSDTEAAKHQDTAAKLKKAMGVDRHLTQGQPEPARTPEQVRSDWQSAVEGNDWSAVIDQQTQQALGTAPAAATPAPAPAPDTTAAASSGPIVSPFMQPIIHRSIGNREGGAAGDGSGAAPALPQPTVTSVDAVLNEVRPYLVADGGDVEVVEVEGRRVFLRLQGSCSTCASSASTMKMGIERAIKSAFGDDMEVIQVDKVDVVTATVENINMHLNMLRGAIHSFGGQVEVVGVANGQATIKYKGPAAIGKGVTAAIRERFPEIKSVQLMDF